MKTPLAARVEAYLKERELSQKQLAASLHEHWARASPSTLEAQLSKLLNGYAAGERLLDKPEVAQALAGMLGVEVEHLQFLRSVPRLLLHPSVCPARREALRRRAEALYQTSDCIREVEATDDELTRLSPHEAVRDRVQNAAEKLGGAVLVIAVASALSDDPAKLYGTAGLALVFAEQHPRGPRIVGKDELLPPRPPGPPRREDADGRRLHHVPAMAAQALAALDGAARVIRCTGGMAPLKERVDDYPLDAAAHAIRRLPRAEVAGLLGRDSNDVHLDGGDIHLQLVTLDHVPVLEGALAGQNRRQREADVAQRAAFSDDDWDDDD